MGQETKYSQMPLERIVERFERWAKALAKEEVLNVFFLPVGDIMFRVRQFTDWYQEKHGTACKVINAETELVVHADNLYQLLELDGAHQPLILLAKRMFYSPDGQALASAVEQFFVERGKGIVILHEGFPLEMDEYVRVPAMSQQRIIWSVYNEQTMERYLGNVIAQWNLTVPDAGQQKIVKYCGGFPWLVNDVLRRAAEGKDLFDESFWWKVERIWQSWPEEYRSILMAMHPTNDFRWKELEQFGLVGKGGIRVPFLRDFVARLGRERMQVSAGKIVVNQVDVTSAFSAGERRILTELTQSKEIISRDVLGKAFWQNEWEKNYSDWALDQVVSRLRKKCKKIGLPISIVTKRGRGYLCE